MKKNTDQAEVSDESLGLEKLLELTWEIEVSVDQVLKRIESAGTNTENFNKGLESITKGIDPNEIKDIRGLVRGLLQGTQRMLDENRGLKNDLGQSAKNIAGLKHSLGTVAKEARTDPLTGIANRREFDAKLASLLDRDTSDTSEFCLLMVDIDHFKNFNDRHGHQVGDGVLKLVANILYQNVARCDTVARYGGEEFAIILLETKLNKAAIVANRLRESVGTKKIVQKRSGTDIGNVTLSIEVAQYIAGETDVELIKRADDAVYAAKRNGRDRVEVADHSNLVEAPPENEAATA